ncbi:ABC transporter ATP-binding protein [Adlercreutzia sp. ZJ141]|uniref:ABC transporter ATP-binding protein n=1 Tax=Adlercreutzia sp. ZJ141 TaxID=2709406 RepID=UPI0013EDB8EC|nr:ATP-binding cassette domain-containing protein [Adlercreutzia sp. ZJ141]
MNEIQIGNSKAVLTQHARKGELQGTQELSKSQVLCDPRSGTFQNEQCDYGSESFIIARDLEMKTLVGYVFRNVSVSVHKGELVAVRGRNGSGKTSLLLALAGRMKHTGGSLTIGGYILPRQHAKAAQQVGMALFEGLNDLQDSLTVAYATSAEFELYGRKPRRDDVMASLRRWHLDSVADQRVKDLNSEQLTVLGISLAFVRHPSIVVVDDIEAQLTLEQSKRLMLLLRDLARERNVGIIVGITERELAIMADTCVYLSKEGE